MLLFGMPGIFGGIAEQGDVRVRDNCEKIKAASGEIADILREPYTWALRSALSRREMTKTRQPPVNRVNGLLAAD